MFLWQHHIHFTSVIDGINITLICVKCCYVGGIKHTLRRNVNQFGLIVQGQWLKTLKYINLLHVISVIIKDGILTSCIDWG